VDGAKGLLSVGVELRGNRNSAAAVSPGISGMNGVNQATLPLHPAHDRRPSSDIKYCSVGSSPGGKMANPRVDAEDVIHDILKDNLLTDIRQMGDPQEESHGGGLALYVSADGSAALGSDDMPHIASSTFRKVFVPTLGPDDCS
jgi:hypothetical protein